jgi:isoquinoline 1-oxidoreductase beta subunit
MKRRTLILGSTAVAGGVLIGYRLQLPVPEINPLLATLGPDQFALTPYVIVDGTGVTVITPRAEMGQGIHGTLAALVAEELDITMADVKVEHGPPSDVYSNTVLHPPKPSSLRSRMKKRLGIDNRKRRRAQLTGAQTSIQDSFVKMRKAGAAARTVLVIAAARQLGIPATELRTANGTVMAPNGNSIPYTDLAADAAGIELPSDPPLKPRHKWTQLGKSQPRVDMVKKCTGTARYAIDMRLPGMLHAVVRLNPRIGGGLISFDASGASKMPGFHKVIPLDDGIIIVASNTWYAMKAAATVKVEWGPAPYPATNAEHRSAVESALDGDSLKRWRDDGDVENALAGSEVYEGSYFVPYLPHATMEPLCAVAWLKEGELEIWAGNQNPSNAQYHGAKIVGLPVDAVRVHTMYMGGGFGRRLEMDFIKTAVHAARALPGIPVKVMWPREEDMTHDVYRPTAAARFRGSVSGGKINALDLKLASPGLLASSLHRDNRGSQGFFRASAMGAMEQPYRIENYRVTAYSVPRLLPVGWWRSVGESQNAFFHESAIDELAHAAETDPLAFRLSLLEHGPSRKVLETIAELSNWNSKVPEGHARGVAYVLSSGAPTAHVIEVSENNGLIRIEKVYVVVDVGIALDPRNIEAQVISSVLFGLCAAIHGEITVANGSVREKNFNDYQLMSCNQAPRVEIAIHESESEIFGVGESATAGAAPALGNAIFAARGQRIRELPFNKSIDFHF